jgi:hypothetical protein
MDRHKWRDRFWAAVLIVFLVAFVILLGVYFGPIAKERLFPSATPVVDIRALTMTNEEMNNCFESNERLLLSDPYDPANVYGAVNALVKSNIIYEMDGMLQKLMSGEAVAYWAWSKDLGLEYTLLDTITKTIYMFSIYCVTETKEGTYPLFDTLELEPIPSE